MEDVDLEAELRCLRNSLQQMKALLAWEQLKQAEVRPNQPPAFQIGDTTETDLRKEYSFFLSTSVQMHSILNDGSVTMHETDRKAIKRQLVRIEQQVYSLNLHKRFFRC